MRKNEEFDPAVVSRIGRLDWIARMLIDGNRHGFHQSRQKGFSTEFSEHKPYAHGDDPRFLDWRLYARTRKPYVRCFEAETDMECCLILDSSSSMAWKGKDGISKLDYARNLAAALVYYFLSNQDRVGLVVMGDGGSPRVVSPSSRRSQLPGLLAVLEALAPFRRPVLADLGHTCLDQLGKRGQIIIFSDLEEDRDATAPVLIDLAAIGHEVLLVHVLHSDEVRLPFDLNTTHFQDSETGKRVRVDVARLRRDHGEQLKCFRQGWEEFCLHHDIGYVFLDTSVDYIEALRSLFLSKQQVI